jgi:hypothetical protein
MRKALVGIAAALMLTTLVIAIPLLPATTRTELYPPPPTYSFIAGATTQGVELDIWPSTHEFNLWQNTVPSPTPLCYGVGATVKAGFLTISGPCISGFWEVASSRASGGGTLTGLVVLTLTFSGKPPTSITLIMKPVAPCAYCE